MLNGGNRASSAALVLAQRQIDLMGESAADGFEL